jgi:hypothetical protein
MSLVASFVEIVQPLSWAMSTPVFTGFLLVLTGWTELVSHMLEELVMPPARLPPIVDALGQAFCDASPEVRATAERELRVMRAARRRARARSRPTLVRRAPRRRGGGGAGGEDPRVPQLRQQRKKDADVDKKWTGLLAFGPPLEAAAAGEKAEVRGRAQAALAKAGGALELTAQAVLHLEPDDAGRPSARCWL